MSSSCIYTYITVTVLYAWVAKSMFIVNVVLNASTAAHAVLSLNLMKSFNVPKLRNLYRSLLLYILS